MCLISFSNFNQFLGKQLRNFSNVAMTLFTGFPEAFGVQYGLTLQNVCRKKKDVLLSEVINNIISTMVEELLKEFENVCTLRVRMPISSDLSNPRNFITKITCYNKVVNIPNSMTVLDELLPNSIEKEKRNCRGIWNFTNPGVVSHNEILEMCRDYIDPDFKCINFNLEEQAKVIVAPRSNNELDTFKLKGEFPEMLSIKDSLLKYVFEPNKKNRLANGA